MTVERPSSDSLAGTLLVIEPWEFGTEHGMAPIEVRLERPDEEHVLVDLLASFQFLGVRFRRLVGLPRYVGDSASDLWAGKQVILDLVPVVGDSKEPDDAIRQAEGWRAWHLIGEARRQRA
jgi:hypothetical protein